MVINEMDSGGISDRFGDGAELGGSIGTDIHSNRVDCSSDEVLDVSGCVKVHAF